MSKFGILIKKLLGKCQKTIETSLNIVAAKKFKDDPAKGKEFVEGTLGRITFVSDKTKAIDNDTDLVVEAIIENIDIKQAFFAELDKIAPAKTIFATNTSSLSVADILRDVKRQDKVAGLHFFSPVPLMKLLEIIRIGATSEDTFQACQEWGKNIGKVTVTCKDKPGFIVNRLLFPYMVEAMNLVDQGDATPKDVDLAMKFGAGYPMGPFELIDFVGLDLNLMILEGWEKKHPDSHLKCPGILKRMVKEGKLGRKSGEGFYKYEKK